ncbi:MAG: glycosyltransferase family 2 protein [Promethearchaeota archaeon]
MEIFKISIVISTINRSSLLRKCVEALICQDNVNISLYEIIIVDNGSKDDTKQIVESLRKKYPNIRYIYSAKLGLSHARNIGAQSSNSEIICFLDDDVIPEKNYVNEMITSFENSEICCVGGKIIASWPEKSPPYWFSAKYNNVVGETSLGNVSRFLKKDEFPFGGNIAIRRCIFYMFEGFNEKLGKKGNNFISGEEIDLCYRLRKKGYKIFFNANAKVFHIVGKKRATKEYFIESIFGKGITEGYQKISNKGLVIFFIYLFIKIFLFMAVFICYLFSVIVPVSEKKRFFLKCMISWYAGYIYFFAINNKLRAIKNVKKIIDYFL